MIFLTSNLNTAVITRADRLPSFSASARARSPLTCKSGHDASAAKSHFGPFHQRFSEESRWGEHSLLSKSAGFSSVGQCFQLSGNDSCWISLTRLATKGFHRPGSPLIQQRVMALSLQWTHRSTFIANSRRTYASSRAQRRAAMSSKRGKLKHFIGATRDFAATKRVSTRPSRCDSRRSTTVPYAFPEASANPCSSSLVMAVSGTWTSARSMTILEMSGNSSFQVRHWVSVSGGSGSSHATPHCHSNWMIIFAFTVYGAKQPNGSKTEASAFNTPLFVSGNSATRSGGRKVNRSDSLCQRIPNVFQSRLPSLGSWSLAGISSTAAGELLAHLARWKPPFPNSSVASFAILLASATLSQLTTKSSTYILGSRSLSAPEHST
ncbi:hypothetical protein T06_7885 [Trichinella sp. T6]|nr:hypothetical protein T06_13278 [Trichinella sp. T6]KRX69269.1 hypothetical protein T06_7885 [Trichinella sp. T6]